MAKRIVYLIIDRGVDGMAPETIIHANLIEEGRDAAFESATNKSWFTKSDRIIDLDERVVAVIAKMDGVDRLAMGFKQRELIHEKRG